MLYHIRSSLCISTVHLNVTIQAYTHGFILTALHVILCHDELFENHWPLVLMNSQHILF